MKQLWTKVVGNREVIICGIHPTYTAKYEVSDCANCEFLFAYRSQQGHLHPTKLFTRFFRRVSESD